jgi:predicted DCC family thiol-disulfide oxidoreductase YuxK
LRRLDRARRLELIPLQRAGASIGDAPPVDRLLARMHVRDAAGHWSIGGEGWLRIAEVVPALRPLARLGQLPFVRPFIGPVYGQVAKNRHRIGRLLGDGACAKPGLRR